MPALQDYVEHFSNLNQLIHELEKREINNVFTDEWYQVKSYIQRDSKGFYAVDSLEEAFKLCRDGWTENLEEFKEPSNKTPTKSVKRAALGPVGFAPHVPNAIQGRPDSMIYTVARREKVRTLSVMVHISVGFRIKQRDMFAAGREIFRAIQNIENNGIRVALDVCFFASFAGTSKQQIIGTVNIKKAQEKLNPKRVYFPLVHPAMLRVIGLAFQETCPVRISSKFKFDRGTPLSKEGCQRIIKAEHMISLAEVIHKGLTAADIKKELLR